MSIKTPVATIPDRYATGLYDVQHFGMIFGPAENSDAPHLPGDINKSWMPGSKYRKVPADYVAAWNKLCIDALGWDPRTALVEDGKLQPACFSQGTMEVGGQLYRNHTTGEIRIFVEPQVIKPAFITSRSADDTRPPIDLVTGETMKDWWDDWHPYGRFHSHNTMGTTPSGTDNDSELPCPGIYAIFGCYKGNKTWPHGYEFAAYPSVVTVNLDRPSENIRRTRLAVSDKDGITTRAMDPMDLIEWDATNKTVYHENVLENIMLDLPKEWEDEDSKWWEAKGKIQGFPGASHFDWDARCATNVEEYDRWLKSRNQDRKQYKRTRTKGKAQFKSAWDKFSPMILDSLGVQGLKANTANDQFWKMRTILNNLDEVSATNDGDAWLRALDDVLRDELGLRLITSNELEEQIEGAAVDLVAEEDGGI